MNPLLAWLLMLCVHTALLLLAAWAVDTLLPSLRGAWRELLWRSALFGGLLTASVQALAPPQSVIGRWHWASTTISLPRAAPEAASVGAAAVPTPTSAHVASTAGAKVPAGHSFMQTAPGSEPVRAVTRPVTLDAVVVLFGAWLAGALVALFRLFAGLMRLRADLARAVPIVRADVVADLAALAAQAGVAPPRLLQLAQLPGPIAAPGARIVLPAWALDTLDRAQLRAMLAHELGHVARADAQWKLLIAGWQALLWFVPPAAIARRRLDEIAELACDAFAANHTGDERSLAECLATCAEHHVPGEALQLAPAMAARPSALIRRIDRLLEGVHMEASESRAVPRTVAALALLGAVFCLPLVGLDAGRAEAAATAPAAPPAADKKGSSTHSSVSVMSDDDGNDTMTISLSDDSHKFKARVEGKIAFNDDETDVTGIGGAGTATFEETAGGVTRRLELADHGGTLERRYFVDRSERPLDAAAREWTAHVVLQLVRSGIGAEQRVKRLHARGGAKLVLDEIAQLPSDYVRGIYLRTLMDLGKLTAPELDRAVRLAGDLGSDYERRQALTAVFDKQALDAAEQVTFLRQALRFDSDYERAELLVGVVPRLADTAAVRQAWLDAALKVGSDYERRRTLQKMLDHGGLDAAQVAAVIDASNTMTSDYEHRELLVAASRQLHDPDAIAVSYARSTQKIASDYERREALTALLRSGRIGSTGANAVLDSAAQIRSSYDCKELLVALARAMPDDAALRQRYREVAGHLPDYERGEAERALAR